MLFWRSTKGLNQNRKKKKKTSPALSLPACTNHLDCELSFSICQWGTGYSFFLKHVVNCGTQNEIVNVKCVACTNEGVSVSWWFMTKKCYYHFGPRHTIIPSYLCLHVLFCANVVLVVSNAIITTWLCLCWRHWDVVEGSQDSIWSLPLFLWLSHEAVAKETWSSSPQSLLTLVLPWVGFRTPVPRMTITAI